MCLYTCAACSSSALLRALCALSRSAVRLSTLCDRALASSAPLEDRSLSYTSQHNITHNKTHRDVQSTIHRCTPVCCTYLYGIVPVSAAVCAVPVGCLALPLPCVVWIVHCPPPLAAHSHGQTLHTHQTKEQRRHTTVW
jgi:hypothetical protein